MVNSRELRIGNKLLFEGQIVEVMAIDEIRAKPDLGAAIGIKYLNYGEVDYIGKWAAKLDYVPLTPELLEQCGFVFLKEDISDCNVDYSLPNSHYWIQNHTECNDYIFYGENSSIEVSLKYLHQLQNLYFALDKEELPINLSQPA